MEHLTLLADSQDAFAIGYTGRSRLFYSQQRGQIFHRIQAAAEAIGCVIKARTDAKVEKIQEERIWYGLNQGDPFVQFHMRKLTPKYNEPRERVISLHDKVLVELDREEKVVACYNYTDIYVLVRDPTNVEQFEIQFRNDQVRKYLSKDRDGVLSLDKTSMRYCEEVETHNKKIFFANTYLTESLITHLEGIDVEPASKKHPGNRPSAGPLVMMGLLQTLEGGLCSRAATTGPIEFMTLVEGVAKFYSTLLKVLFQSRCATTVEACTLLLKTTLEECDPVVASSIRDKALTEGIVLRHFYQGLFDESFDQRCEPPGTSAQIEDYDRLEREAMEVERLERLQEFNGDDDRVSSTSESTLRGGSMDWLSGGETGSLAGSDMSQEKLARKRVSMGEIGANNGHIDHEAVEMIWNESTREELRQALSAEIKRFTRFQTRSGAMKARWNYEDFGMSYTSLANEVVVGGCYIRILAHLRSKMSFFGTVTEEDEFIMLTPEQVRVRNPATVLAALYVRILRENIHAEYRDELETSILCIKSMGVVAAAHAGYVNAVNFEEIGHLWTLMGETVHASMLETFLHTVRALCLHPGNARRVLSNEQNIELAIQLLQLAHSANRDIGDITEPKKLWILETEQGEQLGPFSVNELKQKRDEEHTDMSVFSELAEEVWCSGVYLGQFCEHQNFVISEPLDFMQKLTAIWRAEANRQEPPVDITQARRVLGIAEENVAIAEATLRASFKEKARSLIQSDFAVVNYSERLEELQEAYRVLTSGEKSFLLSKITQQALEGISRMAQVAKNQERLVQAGVLWQLFALFSTYEVELDDITVHSRLQNSLSSMEENFADVAVEVQNLLAIMAVRALCRLGGFFAEGGDLQSPSNALVKRVADALMTPNLSGLLLLSSHHEFLKLFHGECESYTLFWNTEMRQEQATFVSSRSSVEPAVSTVERYVEAIEFRYMYLAELLSIGGLYIEMLMGSLLVIEKSLVPAHVSELGLTEAFFHELFSFIDSGELICPEYVDESHNLQKLPPYAGWGIDKEQLATMDRVTALNCLSITTSVASTLVEEYLVANDSAMKMVLRLLFPPDNEVHQSEDAEKSLVLTPQLFGKASLEFGICDILIELVHICQDVGPHVLDIIRNLCAHGAAAEYVAEILQSGCYLEFIGWVLLVEETIVDDEFDAAESLRIPSAMILSEMVKDGAPLNIESRRALCRFFPPAIVRSIASTPETIVEYIMADHMTPELVWNVEFRNHQRNNIVNFLNIYFSATSTTETEDGKFTSVVDSFEIDYTGIYPAPMTGNVYLTLFMEDPTFNLHDPLQLAHMTSALRATMARADDELIQRDINLIDLVGSSLVCLLQVDTMLLDNVAKMQIPSKCCDFLNDTVRSQACEPCVVNVARVLRVCTISRTCIESLQPMCSTALSCLMALINPVRGGPLHFEGAYVLETMRRIVLQYPEHGDRDASMGIVYLASRLDLFGFLLNILENPDGIGKVKEPHIVRAEAIEILNMLEKDRIQGNTAHQLLKKHKKWQKIYRHEATDVVMSMSTEDPFLQRLYPEADRVMCEYLRMNPRNNSVV
ncbi:hypothetical protein BBP00_00007569 [Phytophthora kernoviae]|uniref:DnaJ homologue subfamily C GRV2/DNAJC13 N-terminal domain-containing protein n=1 Tax=Phytophthora kernoviae TaxID=325452 RepID=A0A3F2RI13_9STRA|nr:hypothetical protein BBP00_00007569 [Phytophthora kernoviae]